jgi:hypothetical protein
MRERTTGGISGKGGSNVNPTYKETVMKKLLSYQEPKITKKDISKIIQSGDKITLKQLEKQIRKNPNK